MAEDRIPAIPQSHARGCHAQRGNGASNASATTTGKRFYDLNRTPIISPYTGETVEIDTGKSGRSLVADKADKKSVKEAVTEEGRSGSR